MISTVNRSRLISRRKPDTVIPPSGNAIFTASFKRNGVSRSIPSGFNIKLPLGQLLKCYLSFGAKVHLRRISHIPCEAGSRTQPHCTLGLEVVP